MLPREEERLGKTARTRKEKMLVFGLDRSVGGLEPRQLIILAGEG